MVGLVEFGWWLCLKYGVVHAIHKIIGFMMLIKLVSNVKKK